MYIHINYYIYIYILISSDFWAFGCIIYQFLTGHPPFKGSNEYQTFQKILKLDYKFPEFNFPSEAKDLISQLLVLNPNERLGSPSKGGVEALKAHPFFDGIEWNTLFTKDSKGLILLETTSKFQNEIVPDFPLDSNLFLNW